MTKVTESNRTEVGLGCLVFEIPGKIPSFKTGKRGTWGKTSEGKIYARPVTKSEHRRLMREITEVIEYELLCAMKGSEAATQMGRARLCSTASRELAATFVREFDDKWKFVRKLVVESEPCDKGCDGATIIIEKL